MLTTAIPIAASESAGNADFTVPRVALWTAVAPSEDLTARRGNAGVAYDVSEQRCNREWDPSGERELAGAALLEPSGEPEVDHRIDAEHQRRGSHDPDR